MHLPIAFAPAPLVRGGCDGYGDDRILLCIDESAGLIDDEEALSFDR